MKLRQIIREEIKSLLQEKYQEETVHNFYMDNLSLLGKMLEKDLIPKVNKSKVKIKKTSPFWGSNKGYEDNDMEYEFEHEMKLEWTPSGTVNKQAIPLNVIINGKYYGQMHDEASGESWEVDDLSIMFDGGYDDELPTKNWNSKKLERFAQTYIGTP